MKLATVLLICTVPVLGANFTTFISDRYPNTATAMTADTFGNTYLTGSRNLGIPVFNERPMEEVFVTKVDSAGNIVLSVVFGGNG